MSRFKAFKSSLKPISLRNILHNLQYSSPHSSILYPYTFVFVLFFSMMPFADIFCMQHMRKCTLNILLLINQSVNKLYSKLMCNQLFYVKKPILTCSLADIFLRHQSSCIKSYDLQNNIPVDPSRFVPTWFYFFP